MSGESKWISVGAVLAGLAVVAGAFAAHGLDDYFARRYADAEPKTVGGREIPAAVKYLEDFKTGARYQMYHALGLIAVGLLPASGRRRWLEAAGWSFLSGIVLFSGSLYVLTLTGETRWGAVAPFGGTLMIVGWLALAVAACPCRAATDPPSTDA